MSVQSALLTSYLAVQVAVSALLMVAPSSERSHDFSWDMFSSRIDCPRVHAEVWLPDGRRKRLDIARAFPLPAYRRRLLYRPRLAQFCRFLCDGLQQKYGADVGVHLDVRCRYAPDASEVALTDSEQDCCAKQ
jgi:hypothetical protein